ncbi:MAG: fasciclin domain-containing protein [Gemmatimonadales bacterium]|nr:MAG: fasciclin domain-containing protein [Gemmatimonadales bacterium]
MHNPLNRGPRGLLGVTSILAVSLTLAACDDSSPADPTPEPGPTIAEIVASDSGFSTLLAALEAANLTGALDDPNATFTVFAPGNAAFGALDLDVLLGDAEALESVLLYHVVPGSAVTASQLEDGQTLTTLEGTQLSVRIDGGEVYIDGARVVTPDLEAENGIVHVIDRTLTGSRNLAGVVTIVDETSELLDAVVAAGLVDAFVGADGWTVFAPDNAAFEAIADVAAGLSVEELQQVLQYHVFADGAVDSATLLGLLGENDGVVVLPTAQGEDVTITLVNAQTIEFNGGQATLNLANLDFFATNGIVHLIDGVLLPPSFGS